ncbi:MAG TPA: SseB family protein [Aeromicrobium sp.]|nr:SseB family protein [Aeromicrobium sp.]
MTGHHRTLAEPQFPDDDGLADERLVAALGDDVAVLGVLPHVRVFVPIVPILGERATDGSDKSADMAAVLMTGADGRQALLLFSGVAALEAWNPAARPVPVMGNDAARAALDEGASAALLDLGGPGFTVIETEDLQHLANGHRLITTPEGPAWVQ